MIAADYAMAGFIAHLQYLVTTSTEARRKLLAEAMHGNADRVRENFSPAEKAIASYNPELMEQYRQARLARPSYQERRLIKSMTKRQLELGREIVHQVGGQR